MPSPSRAHVLPGGEQFSGKEKPCADSRVMQRSVTDVRQIGIVSDVCDAYATVTVSRASACEGCHANKDGGCHACVSFAKRETVTKAENSLGAHPGQRVILETESRTVIFYAAAVFLFPLILAVIAYFAASFIPHPAAPYIGAAAGFILAFVLVCLTLNRSASKRLDVKIIRILE